MNQNNQKSKWSRVAGQLAAGSLATAALIAAFVPFNMGGCGSTNPGAILGGVGSVVTGGGGGGGTGIQALDGGLAGIQFFQASTWGDDKERSLGQSVALNLTNRGKVNKDERLNRYVTMVCQTLVNASDAGGQVYVGILETPDVNAYSGPNGYVMVTTGALRQMRDEAELAGVLAHEIGHIQERHGLEAVKAAAQRDALVKGAAAAAGRDAGWVNALGPFADTILNSVHSQEQEREADADAVRLAARAGYDPNGLTRFLQRLEANQRGGGANLFPSHPGAGERIKNVTAQINREGLGRGQTNAERYKRTVLDVLK